MAGEDLLQEAYLRFLQDPPREMSGAQLKHWFRTVLKNLHIDRVRSRPGLEVTR